MAVTGYDQKHIGQARLDHETSPKVGRSSLLEGAEVVIWSCIGRVVGRGRNMEVAVWSGRAWQMAAKRFGSLDITIVGSFEKYHYVHF